MNWTLANAGSVCNDSCRGVAIGDMRADDPNDFKAVEAAIRERIKNRMIADTTVDVRFETVFPPMPFAPASLPLAEHVQRLYTEAGGTAKINRVSIGAGTDAPFAALRTKGNSHHPFNISCVLRSPPGGIGTQRSTPPHPRGAVRSTYKSLVNHAKHY